MSSYISFYRPRWGSLLLRNIFNINYSQEVALSPFSPLSFSLCLLSPPFYCAWHWYAQVARIILHAPISWAVSQSHWGHVALSPPPPLPAPSLVSRGESMRVNPSISPRHAKAVPNPIVGTQHNKKAALETIERDLFVCQIYIYIYICLPAFLSFFFCHMQRKSQHFVICLLIARLLGQALRQRERGTPCRIVFVRFLWLPSCQRYYIVWSFLA